MKYLSLFTGIGGFELGIEQAYETLCHAHGSEVGGGEEDTQGDEGQGFFPEEGEDFGYEEGRSGERPSDWTDEGPLSTNHSDEKNNRKELKEGDTGLQHRDDHTHKLQCESIPVCIGYSEIDKYATKIYQKHFPFHKNYGDITKINAETLPDFDLLVGGFPCQSFSIAGKRGGFEDTRGTLFFDIARILRAKHPRLFLLENVKGLLSHDNGKTFATIIRTLAHLGYDCQWQVLNSKDFGVPQNRERVFIVGHLRGTPRPEIFPVGANGKADIVIPTLTARYTAASNGGYVRHRQTHQINDPVHSNDRVYATDGISPTLNTAQGGNRQPKIVGGLQAHQKPREDGISPTLTTAMGMGGGQTPIVWRKDIKIRRLTPMECERLQGFPDDWTKYGAEITQELKDGVILKTESISDTQRYKCCGNAVTVNVIKDIMYRMLQN